MPQSPTNWIPKEDCKDRFLYRIDSRNLSFGVFRAVTGGFIGLRTKFGSVYAFEEYHWDNGPPYGTVRPEELLEELPADIVLDTGLGSKCHNCNKTCAYIDFPDGPREKDYGEHKVSIRGEWKHTEPSDCHEVLACGVPNAPLEQWLRTMEKKYT